MCLLHIKQWGEQLRARLRDSVCDWDASNWYSSAIIMEIYAAICTSKIYFFRRRHPHCFFSALTTNCNCSSFCILIFTALTSTALLLLLLLLLLLSCQLWLLLPPARAAVAWLHCCCRCCCLAGRRSGCCCHLSAAADNCNNALSNDNCYNFYRWYCQQLLPLLQQHCGLPLVCRCYCYDYCIVIGLLLHLLVFLHSSPLPFLRQLLAGVL